MSTSITVNSTPSLKAALPRLGTEFHEIRVLAGAYKVDQLRTPHCENRATIELDDEAVIDLGTEHWADMYAPPGGYRNITLGRNVAWYGGRVESAAMFAFLVFGFNRMEGAKVVGSFGQAVQEAGDGAGSCVFVGNTFTDVGLAIDSDDPIYRLIGRVPKGLELEGGGMTFDVWEAARQVGDDERIIKADHPDINNSADFRNERTMLYAYCKQVGYKGAGKHGIYLNQNDHIVRGNRFTRVSGYGVFVNPRNTGQLAHVGIWENQFVDCAAAYSTWDTSVVEFFRNEILVEPRIYGPRWSTGFVLNDKNPPSHEDNTFRWINGGRVTAYRLWNSSPTPVGFFDKDRLISTDGQVPIWGGGTLLTEKEVPEPPVIDLEDRVSGLEHEVEMLASQVIAHGQALDGHKRSIQMLMGETGATRERLDQLELFRTNIKNA